MKTAPLLLLLALLTGGLAAGCAPSRDPAISPELAVQSAVSPLRPAATISPSVQLADASAVPSAPPDSASAMPAAPQSAVAGAPASLAENAWSGASASENSLDDYDDLDNYENLDEQVSDPLEPWNRFWFRFNDALLLKVLKPVHQGYAKVMPEPVRSGIANFAYNLLAPVRMLNSLLQGKWTQAGVELDRFMINTMTSLGFADVAAQNKPRFPYHPELANFGHTLGVWGVADGPYVIWPFFGPTTLRGTVGMVGDSFMKPQSYALTLPQSLGSSAGFGFNSLDKVYEPYEKLVNASLEPYVALRSGFMSILRQQREKNAE